VGVNESAEAAERRFSMKLRFYLANGETHEFSLPNKARVHRALMWVEEEGKKKVCTKTIMIPDEVRTIEVLDRNGEMCAISKGRFVQLKQPRKQNKKKPPSEKEFLARFVADYQKGPKVKYQNPDAW
jgi:hypothetical protein